MIDENDMRYSTCAISSAMVCSAPLITCSVIGSTLLVSWVDCMRSPSGGEPVDVQRAAAADAGDVGGRHQRRRVVLDDDGGARHFVAGLELRGVGAGRWVSPAGVANCRPDRQPPRRRVCD